MQFLWLYDGIDRHARFRSCHLSVGFSGRRKQQKTAGVKHWLIYAGVVELVDSTDLGSVTSVVCGFESRRPHQKTGVEEINPQRLFS